MFSCRYFQIYSLFSLVISFLNAYVRALEKSVPQGEHTANYQGNGSVGVI
jgi:hypothetical protein